LSEHTNGVGGPSVTHQAIVARQQCKGQRSPLMLLVQTLKDKKLLTYKSKPTACSLQFHVCKHSCLQDVHVQMLQQNQVTTFQGQQFDLWQSF